MAIDLTPDYKAKVLHIGLINPTKKVRKKDKNGLVYHPVHVYSKLNTLSEWIYEEFFKAGSEAVIFPLRTEQGPGELVKMLLRDFGVEYSLFVGGIVAPFRATPEQAKRIIEDLRENPQRYFASEEKKEFCDQRFFV
ncbi:hypothetical protein HYV88_06050 [Candidatus Woesearchaeota archaeon]|nr:hypothetical protein [Candidatus Woesearchaeota archaeon]